MTDITVERYASTKKQVTVTAAQDLFELLVPTGKRIEIVGLEVGQTSDFGDAQAEILSIVISRGYTSGGSGGSTVTPAPLRKTGAPASGCTAKCNNTTPASGGSPVDLYVSTWNVAAGAWAYPEAKGRIGADAGERIVVTITAPADALTVNQTLIYDEYNVVS